MQKNEIGKVFPNLKRTIAYYSPVSFFITLNEIKEAEYDTLFLEHRDMVLVKKTSIFIHEVRHNLDHFATLWGQKNLLKLAVAINARLSNNEAEFHKILPLKKEENQFHYDEYYTEHQIKLVWNNPDDNWIWDISSGIKFNLEGKPDEKSPIVFIKFYDKAHRLIVRVPLSIAALLETNSINDEFNHVATHINALPNDEKIVENNIFSKTFMADILYNQEMAVYNSIVHLTANILKLNDVIIALKISSSISSLALNLPHNIISKIPINATAQEYWGKRNDYMIENNEYGFIFYNLLINYSKVYKETKKYNLSDLLSSNNLPDEKQILDLILAELHQINDEFGHLKYLKSDFERLSSEGTKILKIRGIDSQNILTEDIIKSGIFNPDVIYEDTDFDLIEYNITEVLKKDHDNLSVEERYSFMDFINSKLDEFFIIRGL